MLYKHWKQHRTFYFINFHNKTVKYYKRKYKNLLVSMENYKLIIHQVPFCFESKHFKIFAAWVIQVE